MGYASQGDYYVPSGVLSEEEKRDAVLRGEYASAVDWREYIVRLEKEKAALIAKIKGTKDDGFVPFDHMIGTSLKHGDTVRLHDAIVLEEPSRGGNLKIGIGGVVYTAAINSIAAVRRKPPEPLKVGDIVSHKEWQGATAEIAGIKDGQAAFWPIEDSYNPRPRPLSELERVK
jgi:hypothetical protein